MKTSAINPLQRLSQSSDLMLVVLLGLICALIILPLPLELLDFLIGTNIAISITLLMSTLYCSTSTALSTFPTLLLFTTLFRLGLNIASTRNILIHADAGKIIETFGSMVVMDNYIVGGILFIIITIVQFMVITKGAERVAEVGARFTLDSMPGKQMSIDADLRAGGIDNEAAKANRAHLEKESQFHGAMDGAMKFVKGDAIAGLIINAINIIGGVIIGVTQKGMETSKALSTYAVLTIGDGMVSQIPALLICIAAGMIVTRVSTPDAPHLAADILKQFGAQPRALVMSSILILAFMLMPGFPIAPFLILGLLLGGIGLYQLKSNASDGSHAASSEIVKETPPLAIHCLFIGDPQLAAQTGSRAKLEKMVDETRRAMIQELGMPFPPISLRLQPMSPQEKYQFCLLEVPVETGKIHYDDVALSGNPTTILEQHKIEYVRDEIQNDLPIYWIRAKDQYQVDGLGLKSISPPEFFQNRVQAIFRKYAHEFLGLQETKALIDMLEKNHGALAKELLKAAPLPKITEILKALVHEGISLRNLRPIAESIIEWAPKEKDPLVLADLARLHVKRYISHRHTVDGTLYTFLIDPELEESLRGQIKQNVTGNHLVLAPHHSKALIQSIRQNIQTALSVCPNPVLVCSVDIRRPIRRLLDNHLPLLPVIAQQEIVPGTKIKTLGRITPYMDENEE